MPRTMATPVSTLTRSYPTSVPSSSLSSSSSTTPTRSSTRSISCSPERISSSSRRRHSRTRNHRSCSRSRSRSHSHGRGTKFATGQPPKNIQDEHDTALLSSSDEKHEESDDEPDDTYITRSRMLKRIRDRSISMESDTSRWKRKMWKRRRTEEDEMIVATVTSVTTSPSPSSESTISPALNSVDVSPSPSESDASTSPPQLLSLPPTLRHSHVCSYPPILPSCASPIRRVPLLRHMTWTKEDHTCDDEDVIPSTSTSTLTSIANHGLQCILNYIHPSSTTSTTSQEDNLMTSSSHRADPIPSLSSRSSSSSPSPSPPSPRPTTPPSSSPFSPPPLSSALTQQTSSLSHLIRRVYQLTSDEQGHFTVGHSCITEEEKMRAKETGNDLLYGEILPDGVTRLLDDLHLHARRATSLYDLGSGLGKCAMQAFLQFPNLQRVVGIELAASRVQKGVVAANKMAALRGCVFTSTCDSSATITECVSLCPNHHHTSCPHYDHGHTLQPHTPHYPHIEMESKEDMNIRYRMTRKNGNKRSMKMCSCGGIYRCNPRTLEFRTGDLFECGDVATADIVLCETKVPEGKYRELCRFLMRCKAGVRLLTYENLDDMYERCEMTSPFTRMSVNTESDRVHTTWAPRTGYRFHLWTR